jgi:hypothetical protein
MNVPQPTKRIDHEDVDPADQVVDLPAVSRGERRHSEPFSHDVRRPLELRPFVVELDIRDALRALAEIEKEGHEPALHREGDSSINRMPNLVPCDHRRLLRREAHRAGDEQPPLHRSVLVLRRNHES